MVEASPKENVDTVKFHPGECLLLSEVSVILQKRREESAPGSEMPNVFNTTMDYVTRFSAFKSIEVTVEVRRTLARLNLSEYELVSLANLCPETPEEAKSLIPTLKRLDDPTIEAIISDIKNFKRHS